MVHVFLLSLSWRKAYGQILKVSVLCVYIHTNRRSTHACIHGTMEDLFLFVLFAQLKTEGLPLLTLLN